MSDIRFTMMGIGLIFAGFIVLGVFGSQYYDVAVQVEEFGDCYDYSDENLPIQIDCEGIMQDRVMFFALVLGLIAAGIIALVKGVKGTWDQNVRPEDMLGPGGPANNPENNTDEDKK